jgi:hypothetical protein
MDNKKYLMELEDLTELRITGYSVGVGRIHFEFMDWIKLSGPTSSPRILRKSAQHFGKSISFCLQMKRWGGSYSIGSIRKRN